MNITLAMSTFTYHEVQERTGEDFINFNLDDLFENVVLESDMILRLETRIKAVARIMGGDPEHVVFDDVDFESYDITPPMNQPALHFAMYVAQFWNWAEGRNDWDYLPIVARIVEDEWRYMDFDNLNDLAENCVHHVHGTWAQFAQDLVDDGLLEEPGEGWDAYIDWEAKGEDIANDYAQYEYDGVTYLFV